MAIIFVIVNNEQPIAPAYWPKWKLYGIHTAIAKRLNNLKAKLFEIRASGKKILPQIGKMSHADSNEKHKMVAQGTIMYTIISQIGYEEFFFSQK